MMRMFEWRGRLTLVAIWLLLAAPAHAGGASLNHDYGSSGPEAPASLDVSQPAVNFSWHDFSAVDFDGALLGELLGRPHAHGAQAFLACSHRGIGMPRIGFLATMRSMPRWMSHSGGFGTSDRSPTTSTSRRHSYPILLPD